MKLSKYQIKILQKLAHGYVAYTTEGANYSCWISKTVDKITIRKDTLSKLFDIGMIEISDDSEIFASYRLSKKGEKYINKNRWNYEM